MLSCLYRTNFFFFQRILFLLEFLLFFFLTFYIVFLSCQTFFYWKVFYLFIWVILFRSVTVFPWLDSLLFLACLCFLPDYITLNTWDSLWDTLSNTQDTLCTSAHTHVHMTYIHTQKTLCNVGHTHRTFIRILAHKLPHARTKAQEQRPSLYLSIFS